MDLEVLSALKKMHITPPPPFSQNAQYKKNFDSDGIAGEDGGDGNPPIANKSAQSKMKKKKKQKPSKQIKHPVAAVPPSQGVEESDGVYKAKEYSSIRKAFIQDLKSQGFGSSEANEGWNGSEQKRRLLASLPLTELKRRRFVPKGTVVNPFAINS